jgi:hypothetical protein
MIPTCHPWDYSLPESCENLQPLFASGSQLLSFRIFRTRPEHIIQILCFASGPALPMNNCPDSTDRKDIYSLN